MAHIIGEIPPVRRAGLAGALLSRLSGTARLRSEFEQGEGLRRVIPIVKALPESVTAIIRPKLGFMHADLCLIGPGKVLVVQTLHWRGKVSVGEKGEWVSGSLDLGRPDRTAHVFADRLRFSGHTRGHDVAPVVIATAGPLTLLGTQPLAPLVSWEEAGEFLRSTFPPGLSGLKVPGLLKVLQS